jgi:undecaprenyl-diphosphatase
LNDNVTTARGFQLSFAELRAEAHRLAPGLAPLGRLRLELALLWQGDPSPQEPWQEFERRQPRLAARYDAIADAMIAALDGESAPSQVLSELRRRDEDTNDLEDSTLALPGTAVRVPPRRLGAQADRPGPVGVLDGEGLRARLHEERSTPDAVLETLAALDTSIGVWCHGHGTPALTALMLVVTNLHSQLALSIYAGIFALYLARRHEWRWVWTVALVVPPGLVINAALKLAVQRARPDLDDALVRVETYSFPSGHAAGATLLYGVLAAYALTRTRSPRLRIAILAAAAFMVALVSFTRVYLGAHYVTDVIGGIAWAAAWVALVTFALGRMPWTRTPR